MGDIGTHRDIVDFVVEQCRPAVDPGVVPPDHYDYLELGNYLTDVSQTRDPPAHHNGRGMARTQAFLKSLETFAPWAALLAFVGMAGVRVREEDGTAGDMGDWMTLLGFGAAGVAVVGGLAVGTALSQGSWAPDLFGQSDPEEQRHGAMAEFFRRINRGWAHQRFTPEGHDAMAASSPIPITGLALAQLRGWARIPSNRLDEVMNGVPAQEDAPAVPPRFTQYWPHEHLDFPYVEDAENHEADTRFQPDERRLLRYLEHDILALAQQLSRLEQRWVEARGDPAVDRTDLMVELGHLLHAVEDYWFHSNFAEVHRWSRVRAVEPTRDPDADNDRGALLTAALADGVVSGADERETTRLRRTLHRRLRYPAYTGKDLSDLSDETSRDGTNRIFTGAFGSTDIWHTLGKALEGMERDPVTDFFTDQLIGPPPPPGTDPEDDDRLVLFRLLFREAERRAMVAGGDEMDRADDHKRQLVDEGRIHAELDRLHAQGRLCERAHEEFTAAFDLDRELEERHEWLPGVGGMLIQLLGMMQSERSVSDARQEELNRPDSERSFLDATREEDVVDRASTNAASVENVGTHSLMAKDSPERESEPFRDDAVRLASHASATVARHLLVRVASGPGPDQGIDWHALLRHYLPFPDVGGADWWVEVLAAPQQPDVTAVADAPPPTMLSGAALEALRTGGKLGELQDYYRGFEQ